MGSYLTLGIRTRVMTTLRWGICGAGLISSDFCSALKTLPSGEHEIVAVAARDVSRSKEFADKFAVKKAYGSYEELAIDPDIDVIYIGTIHIKHHEHSILMLKAGKHVLCEKPMAINLKQCREILKVAKESKRFFMEATWSRSLPIYEQIREELASGRLGDVQMVTAKLCIPLLNVERIANNKLGGGCLLDVGVYTLQFACMVYDENPEQIIATGYVNKNGIDENGAVILKYSGGRLASLAYSAKTHWVENNNGGIHGTKGSIELPTTFWCPKEAIMPSGKYTNDFPQGPEKYNFINAGGLRYQADKVRTSILEGKTECYVMPHRHSEMMFTITDEIRRQIGLKYNEDD
ncbi:hypothetical protein KUTeg_004779 [Tegillarca granosa]|uniref:Trans-1,2-dihydrobenzene-1,2-diol dehydrogenase n=1 Tax=Tegillarca granosa TaxID=220873 RepID=A0ABQ9FMG7_TEGGR|nr:hypothetical protein KUTeg_004779 [Tegillarca granosa]